MTDDLVKRLRDKLRDRKTRFKESFEAADRIEELEANLARALEALSGIEGWTNNPEIEEFARNTIAELSSVSCANTTGGKDE